MRIVPLGMMALAVLGLVVAIYLPANAGADIAESCAAPVVAVEGKTAEQWRAEGPGGLANLIEAMQPSISAYATYKAKPAATLTAEESGRLAEAKANVRFIDQVAQQRDGHLSELFWYTDLEAAKAQAKRTGRPILSLRLLGNLSEEYSCANSRFFRTSLYADESVSKVLREKYVLHWQSVRPVPVITIDMGDGRTIKRTITGNSAHYVLDAKGRVVDCLPGLYGSGTFKRVLNSSISLASSGVNRSDQAFIDAVKNHHQEQASAIDFRWSELASGAQVSVTSSTRIAPDAREAGAIAWGKGRVEAPLVNAVLSKPATPADADSAIWDRVAMGYADEAKLDAKGRAMMKQKTFAAEEASNRAFAKSIVEDPMVAMVRNFERAVALDTARNEHLLRREICDWFMAAQSPLDFDEINRRVYAELFLTPEDDPWLGLVPADTYSALDGGGLIQNAK